MHCGSRAVHLLLLVPCKPGIRNKEERNGKTEEQSRIEANVPNIDQQPYQHDRSHNRHVPSHSPDEGPKFFHREALSVEEVLFSDFVVDFQTPDCSKPESKAGDL